MKKQGVMICWGSKEQDEEYSRVIADELVKMKLLRGLLGGKDEGETLIYDLNVIHPRFPLVGVDI